jgi:predicted PurR-regulated permease PerM
VLKKRVEAEIVEGVIAVMMALFGATAIYVLYKALILSRPDPLLVVVELMLLLLVGILALVFVGVKIWEQGIESNQHHKKTHQKLEEEP